MGIRGIIMFLLIVIGGVLIAFPFLPKIFDELAEHFTPLDDDSEDGNTNNEGE